MYHIVIIVHCVFIIFKPSFHFILNNISCNSSHSITERQAYTYLPDLSNPKFCQGILDILKEERISKEWETLNVFSESLLPNPDNDQGMSGTFYHHMGVR